MNNHSITDFKHRRKFLALFFLFVFILVSAVIVAWLVQRDFGNVEVSNVTYQNENGIRVRAKLLKPIEATPENPLPGVVYIHGYQNNRETSDAYCIEMARRGFVVLNIDAIGRGNSGIPGDPKRVDFDETYGGRASLAYLQTLPFVDTEAVGMMGHSLGAEMAYKIAIQDEDVKALVISGFGYTLEASSTRPPNMLMIIGKWDEYRERMTGVQDIVKEWMDTPQTQQAIPVDNPQIGKTYGDFGEGTARRVYIPNTIHVQEAHHKGAIAEAVDWMKNALNPPEKHWINLENQIWAIKEWSTLVAMLACFAALIPLGELLLHTKFYSVLKNQASGKDSSTGKQYFKLALINSGLMWLYLPLIFVLFGLHVYVIPIDKLFPMMMVNGTVWWFMWINVIGFLLFRRWYKRKKEEGLTLEDLGVSYQEDGFSLNGVEIGKTALLGLILFAFAYLSQYLLEKFFIVDFRFVFPFASDLTPYRWGMFLLYFPFFLIGFIFLGFFLHGQMRRPHKTILGKTFASWTFFNILVMVLPLLLFLMIQYIPLFTIGIVPLVGPGGMLASFTMNLFHMIGVLLMIIPLSTWFYLRTGRPYLGALINAALVTWMFISSQVIAPIPV